MLDTVLLEDFFSISYRKASFAIILLVSNIKAILALKEKVEVNNFRLKRLTIATY